MAALTSRSTSRSASLRSSPPCSWAYRRSPRSVRAPRSARSRSAESRQHHARARWARNGRARALRRFPQGLRAVARRALLAASLPPLVIVPITTAARRWLVATPVAGLVRGVALATAGLLAATGIGIVTAGGAPEWWQLTLVAIGTVLTYDGRVHPALVIAIGVVAGVALGR